MKNTLGVLLAGGAGERLYPLTRDRAKPAVPALAALVMKERIVSHFRGEAWFALRALTQLGPNARGVAVLRPTVTDAELKSLNEGGIRGIRFTVGNPKVAVVSIDMIEPLAKRIADFGWHVQLNMTREQIAENADLLRRLPVPVVFDHLGSLKPPEGIEHPAYGVIRGLIDKGRAWVKLSGAYSNTVIGPPTYADATKVAQAYVKAAPERLVWGSDWPHPSEPEHKPNDAILFDLLAEWAPDAATRNRILVANPETLYGFSKTG